MEKEIKDKIVHTAMVETAKILIHTMMLVEAPNYIKGHIVDDSTGAIYELKFERKFKNVELNTRPKEGEIKP